MKQKMNILKKFAALLTLMLIMPAHTAFAASNIYVALGTKTATYGSTFMVGIRMNSSSKVNAVQANITYPADKLTYISTSFVGSAFEIQAESSAGGGSIRIARGTTTPVSGDNSIGFIMFKAKVDSGSASFTVSDDSNLVNDGNVVSSGGIGATVNFSATAPQKAVATTPEPVADTTPPTISEISTSDVKQSSVTIKWKTNEAADSLVEYGLTNAYGLNVSNTEKVTAHSLVLASAFISPKTTYHYRITTVDGSGNKTVSEDKTFATSGYVIYVTVQDKSGKAIAGASVSTEGVNAKTDSSGHATLNVTQGKKTVVASKNKQTTSKDITVLSDPVKKAELTLVLEKGKSSLWLLPFIGGGMLLYVLGALTGFLLYRHFKPKVVKAVKSAKTKRAKKRAKKVEPTEPITIPEVEQDVPTQDLIKDIDQKV